MKIIRDKEKLTLGSLFDGSGGFPLAGTLCGITPLWAAEVEPYPVAVTRSRFPKMRHLGDVAMVRGGEIAPVDIITFGSPCQDLSVAGKRAGIKHEAKGDETTTRSGLFMEAIRIIKEMRQSTDGVYPKFAVWENVPGAFSSHNGEDFRIVLEEFVKIVEPSAQMPAPDKNGWPYADCYVGDGWSVAYRTLDAQYWGVPQRRRRIYLVADFRGQRAGEILFEREGLSGNFAAGGAPWKGAAGSLEESPGETGTVCLNDQGSERMDVTEDVTCTLRAEAHHPPCVMGSAGFCTEHSDVVEDTPKTLKIRSGCEGGGKGALIQDDLSATLACNNDQTVFVPFVKGTRPHSAEEGQQWKESDVANTLNTHDVGEARCNELAVKVYGICSKDSNAMKSDNPKSGFYEADTSRTLDGNGGNPSCNQGGMAVVALEGNGARPSHQGCGYSEDDVSYTLNATEQHAVAYGIDRATYNMGQNAQFGIVVEEELEPTMVAKGPGAVGQPVYHSSKNSFHTNFTDDAVTDTLVATDFKDPPTVSEEPYYIVRRLTPTECARLQGFPDRWGDINKKEDFSEEEYRFWAEVRNTHAAINGKKVRNYTKKQMLTWYNKLHTDSAEYKMWGNGIALPTALYVMQGVAAAEGKEIGGN